MPPALAVWPVGCGRRSAARFPPRAGTPLAGSSGCGAMYEVPAAGRFGSPSGKIEQRDVPCHVACGRHRSSRSLSPGPGTTPVRRARRCRAWHAPIPLLPRRSILTAIVSLPAGLDSRKPPAMRCKSARTGSVRLLTVPRPGRCRSFRPAGTPSDRRRPYRSAWATPNRATRRLPPSRKRGSTSPRRNPPEI